LPVAFIDWDTAGPISRLDEVAASAWWNAQLHDDDIAERQALPPAGARAAQLRYFLDGYRLPAAERHGLVTRMIEYAIRAQVTPDSTDLAPLWAIAWRGRSAAWMSGTGHCWKTPSPPDPWGLRVIHPQVDVPPTAGN